MTLSVIGAGFGRTGTASLKIALEQLGFGPCYHMSEVLSHAGHVDLWTKAADGAPDWEAIFKGFKSTVDFPAASYWRGLSAYYPDAKVILSLRDPESWFTSTQETILSPTIWEIIGSSPWGAMIDKTIHRLFDGKPNDHDTLIRVFNEHNAAVKAALPPARLLVFEAKEGWAPLCKFLNVAIPDGPYPRVNSKEDVQAIFDMIKSPVGLRMMQGLGMGEGKGSVHEELFEKR